MVLHQPENGPGLVQKKYQTQMLLCHSGLQMLVLVFFVVVLSPFSRFGLNSFLTKQPAYGFKRSKFWLTQPVDLGKSRRTAFHQIHGILSGRSDPTLMSSFHQIPPPNTGEPKTSTRKCTEQPTTIHELTASQPRPISLLKKVRKTPYVSMASRHLSPALIIHEIPSNHPRKFS